MTANQRLKVVELQVQKLKEFIDIQKDNKKLSTVDEGVKSFLRFADLRAVISRVRFLIPERIRESVPEFEGKESERRQYQKS